ncbi:MAG TPA: hypothetical protein VHT53_00425 [Candidatus Elarobacter sp.]|jgi:hypothetical protein|nr:hypothetical protein [Candidatus Elarobacter sp.]
MKAVAVSLAACALAVASAGAVAQPAATPAPAPFVIGTLQPFGTGGGDTSPSLPKIGGTRALTPPCAAMRDVIIPAFKAAQHSDGIFVETRKRLPQYTDLINDTLHHEGVYRESALKRLDDDATHMMTDATQISRLLGDPRLSKAQTDPDVVAERKALQVLYEAQAIRANQLNEFVMRQRVAIAKNGIDTSTGAYTKSAPAEITQAAPPIPDPVLTAPPGMPVLQGNDMTDRNAINTWSTEMARTVRTNENVAARTFYRIASGCK